MERKKEIKLFKRLDPCDHNFQYSSEHSTPEKDVFVCVNSHCCQERIEYQDSGTGA